MSIRAYIVREDNIWVDKYNKTFYFNKQNHNHLLEYTHKDEEYCFNFWGQHKFADIIRSYCYYDGTNEDSVGTMEMEKEDFEELYDKNSFTNEQDLESLNKIKQYFNEGNYYIIFNCY